MDMNTDHPVGNPTPIGLMGLALGCAALAPSELGLTDVSDPAIWVWMLITAGALQIYAGVMDLINRNVLGATSFTIYGTLWLISGWMLSSEAVFGTTAAEVKGYIYLVFLAFTLFMTIGFATVSRTLTIVFAAFIVIFTVEIAAAFIPSLHGFALTTAGLLHTLSAVLCLWAAAGSVLNPLLGRNIFPQGHAPLAVSHSPVPEVDDFESLVHHLRLRKRIVSELYHFWEANAWDWMPTSDVSRSLSLPPEQLAPDFWYLYQKGFVGLDEDYTREHPQDPKHVRITSDGIDYYRELQMGKFRF